MEPSWKKSGRTRGNLVVTAFVMKSLEFHGLLYAHGYKITRRFGQSPIRWQIMGVLEDSGPLTVSQIARRIGSTRQGIQRLITEMTRDGTVSLTSNPDHARSPKVILTQAGQSVLNQINRVQSAWADQVARDVVLKDVEAATAMMKDVSEVLREIEKKESGHE